MDKAQDAVTIAANSEARTLKGHGGSPPGGGPFISVHLKVVGDTIASATYESYPCPAGHACGKALCQLVTGQTLAEASQITHSVLVHRVGPLPRHRKIAYGLALLALEDALRNSSDRDSNPDRR